MSASPRIPERTNGRSGEAAALLAAARAVLEKRAFADAAAAVLEASRSLLGAGAGIVALRAANGKGFEVARLEAGGLEVDAAAGLPA
ncbi:MAG TPA: hypothetical protein VLA75_08770, partial [Thermoanaerobaculia bacterium]|nr:hypothetical protein [Thermoanaerobaculia bacterium]